MPTQALTYVEIDIPEFVVNSPPDSPVVTQTFRFAVDAHYLPGDIDAIPSIKSVEFTPATISLGHNLGQRATLKVVFTDHRHIFDTEAFDSGTFWGKFRARYGLKLRGYAMRFINGYVGQAIGEMETRHFLIDSTDGPSTKGEYQIIAKDILKFADSDRAQAPVLSNGFLVADIVATEQVATLSPTGVGDEYPLSGYVAIGGSEICAYEKVTATEIDSDTKLLLHGDGDDGSTTITDSSPSAHTMTANGTAAIDRDQSKFNGASLSFAGGSGNHITTPTSSDWAFGSGNFTIDFWVRFGSVASGTVLFCRGNATNQFCFFFNASGVLRWRVLSGGADIFSSAFVTGNVFVTNTWYHIAIVRNGNTWDIYKDGTSAATVTDSDSIPDPGTQLVIGAIFDGTQGMVGHLDEFRISKGVARWTTTFTPPTHPYLSSTDQLFLTHAQFNTEAQAHSAQDRVQLCLEYDGEDVADIIYDLLTTYAAVDPDFIPLSSWQAETAAFLGVVYTALIAEPTGVNDLISELAEQAALAVWWNDVEQQINLQVLRLIPPAAEFNEDNTLTDTLEVTEQPEKRVSQVYTYFGKINPLIKADQIDNYRSTAFSSDPTADVEYGSPAIKKIYSRWIPSGGRAIAELLNAKQLGRYRDPPRRFNFNLFRYAGTDPILGQGYDLLAWLLQETDGTPATVPVQVTRLNAKPDHYELEAEEVLFTSFEGDTTIDTVIFDANENDINLQERHDELYPVAQSGDTINAVILAGVIIGSTSAATPAFEVGTWPGGVTVNLQVIGRIQGKGGTGGAQGTGVSGITGLPGSVGGTALKTTQAINLDVDEGEIWAGGGGGGGGAGAFGGAGGGGAGTQGGPAGAISGTGHAANPGTSEAGGNGGAGPFYAGGNGGGPGLAGSAGSGPAPDFGAGGDKGNAIDGISFVTVTEGPGDRRGYEIN